MTDDMRTRARTQAERWIDVRRYATYATHALVGALATDDGVELTMLVGEADGWIEKARNELLRGQI